MLTGYCETTWTSEESDMGNFSCMTETLMHKSPFDYWLLKKKKKTKQNKKITVCRAVPNE